MANDPTASRYTPEHPLATLIRVGPKPVRKPRAGRPGGPSPGTWKSGPDPVRHAQYMAWAKSRAQAHFRKELWELTYEQWVTAWAGQWHLRGRSKHSVCITRADHELSWTWDNVQVITRAEHCQRCNQLKTLA